MGNTNSRKVNLKEKISHELTEYFINVCYLTLAFATFTWYRRIILDAHYITYTNYGFAVIQALILGKVVMIGDLFKLGRRFENKRLIYSTLYKAVLFSFFVTVFALLEYVAKGLMKGAGFMGGIAEFFGKGPHELVGNFLIVFVAFVPFFGFKELGRVFGQENIWALFFKKQR